MKEFLGGASTDWLPADITAADVAFTDDDGWLSFTAELQLVTEPVGQGRLGPPGYRGGRHRAGLSR